MKNCFQFLRFLNKQMYLEKELDSHQQRINYDSQTLCKGPKLFMKLINTFTLVLYIIKSPNDDDYYHYYYCSFVYSDLKHHLSHPQIHVRRKKKSL